MLSKPIILLVILGLLIVFYFVIRFGAGNKKDIQDSKKMQSSNNTVCYLLKEIDLSASMRTLYDHYVRTL